MMQITYIYAMKNMRNGYVKIGRSDYPEFREKTLQSEEPEVEILFYMLAPSSTESYLHSLFAKKRVRGEWFSLSDYEIVKCETKAQFYVYDFLKMDFSFQSDHYRDIVRSAMDACFKKPLLDSVPSTEAIQ